MNESQTAILRLIDWDNLNPLVIRSPVLQTVRDPLQNRLLDNST